MNRFSAYKFSHGHRIWAVMLLSPSDLLETSKIKHTVLLLWDLSLEPYAHVFCYSPAGYSPNLKYIGIAHVPTVHGSVFTWLQDSVLSHTLLLVRPGLSQVISAPFSLLPTSHHILTSQCFQRWWGPCHGPCRKYEPNLIAKACHYSTGACARSGHVTVWIELWAKVGMPDTLNPFRLVHTMVGTVAEEYDTRY